MRASREASGLLSSLIWIWGSPRSGSTWLLKLLGTPLDPDPEAPLGFHEPDGAAPPYDVMPIDETFISNHLAPALADPRRVEGRWLPGTINNLLQGKPTYVFSDEYREVWSAALRSFVEARIRGPIDRAAAAGVEFVPDPTVVIKETNGTHAADLLMGALPESRLLLLIRDPRDVVDSLLHAYQPGGFFARNQGRVFADKRQRRDGLLWAARLWACNTDVALRAIEAHPPELSLTVRYEDLLADPPHKLHEIQRWAGLDRGLEQAQQAAEQHSFSRLPADKRGPLTRNRAARPGLWRENLSRREQSQVNEICGPLIDRFGYEL